MTDGNHAGWRIGDPHYAIFLRDHAHHEPRRTGVVTAVGRAGITVRLDRPNWKGEHVEQWPFHASPQFRTLDEAQAWCLEHPEPNVGRVEREAAAPTEDVGDDA